MNSKIVISPSTSLGDTPASSAPSVRKRERIRQIKKEQITVTMSPRLLKEVDAVASSLEVARAIVISSATKEYIERHYKKMFTGSVTASALASFILEKELFDPSNKILRAELEQAAHIG